MVGQMLTVLESEAREIEAERHGREFQGARPLSGMALRSYCALLVYQNRAGKMLGPDGLAKVCSITLEQASEHIYLCQERGFLSARRGRWEFAFVPRVLNRYVHEG